MDEVKIDEPPIDEILMDEFLINEPRIDVSSIKIIQNKPLIIYHEGGDSYRLLLIIQLNNIEWIKNNSLFYLTSGRSNKGFDFMANTFLPTLGLVNSENLNQYNSARDEPVEVGHIIKMSDVSKVLKKYKYPTTQK